MKIIYGITKSNFGGAQRYVFDLATEAKKAGHDVAVLCGGNGPLVQKLEAEKIRVITIPGFGRDIDLIGDASRLLFIIKTLRTEKPDVFHINSAKMGGAGIFTGRLLGIKKIIFTGHGWAFNEPRPWWQKTLIKFFTWMTIFCAHKTICVSEKSKKDVEKWPFIKHKLSVIHNGIALFDLLPWDEARRFLSIVPSGKIIVGTLAELHPIKGLDVLLRAWQKFEEKYEAELVILGEGEERQRLLALARELGITQSVSFKGFVPEARKYLGAFDIFVLPSRSENLPYALLEAGLAGLPAIASHVGGIPEIITTSESGILVEPENHRELLSSLLLIAEDKNLRARLGENLKKKVSSEFSIQKTIAETLKMYRN